LIGQKADRSGRWLAALALVIYITTTGGSLTTTDAVATFDVTKNLIEHRSVAMTGNLLGSEAERGRDGRYYSPFGIGQSLYNVPFYLAGRSAARWISPGRVKPDTIEKAAVGAGVTIAAAAVVYLTYQLAVAITGSVGAALLGAVTVAFASILWPYARFGFNQPLACAALAAAVNALVRSNRWSSRLYESGLWVGVSLLVRHEMILGALPMVVWIVSASDRDSRARMANLLRFMIPVTAALAIWLTFNYWRFGDPLDTGLRRDPVPGFGSPVIPGLLGLFFSPSASVLLYSPFAVLGLFGLIQLARTRPRDGGLLLALVAIFAVMYASLGNWLGGRSYGSRYLVVVLPYLACGWAWCLVVLSNRVRRIVFVLVVTTGIIVQLPGVLVDYAKVSQTVDRGESSVTERQWSWQTSPLVLNTRAAVRQIPANIRYVLGHDRPPVIMSPRDDADRSFSQQFAFSLDFWWLYLFYLGALPRAGVLAVLVGATLMAAFCVSCLRVSAVEADAARRRGLG
jgi:hypothetical protein